jgi:O-antigen/teichoic acid export membrane protein
LGRDSAPDIHGADACCHYEKAIIFLEASSNKRIIKNTLFLYFRMFLIMAISLYSSRLILEALGVEDFGLYNVVGGIVSLFSIINGALSSGSSRFITFELGRGDPILLRKTFSASFIIHALIALLVLVVAETLGLWYVNTFLVVPKGRLYAANWVYQLSIISSMLSLTQVPYSAVIIAHERMNVYAGVSIAEGVYKLLLVFLLQYMTIDKLICYGLLVCIGSVLVQLYYRFYCFHNFSECKLMLMYEKKIYKNMLSFSLWDVMGSFTVQGNSQGINLLINYFFGVAVNAARGIAFQVETAMTMFSNNFMTAVKPQIVKLFAEGKTDKMLSLVFESSKYSFFLLYVIALPVFFEADYLLEIWLKEVPQYSVLFLRYILISRLIRTFATPVVQAVHASGNIKWLNIFGGGTAIVLQIPLTFIYYKLGYSAESAFIVMIAVSFICNFIELVIMKREIKFSILQYICKVYLTGIIVAMIAFMLLLPVRLYIFAGFLRLMLICLMSIVSVGCLVFFIGMNQKDRTKIIDMLKKKMTGF